MPLVKKLKDCNVFGVFSCEHFANRDEWEQKGQMIVAEYVEKLAGTTIHEGDEEDECVHF